MNQKIDKISKYKIRKSSGLGQEFREIAELQIDSFGRLTYKMLAEDSEIEQVFLEAQEKGGLFCRVPFTEKAGNLVVMGQKREFIPTTDREYFVDAIQDNLKSGLAEEE